MLVFFVPRLRLLVHGTSLSPGNVFHGITVGSEWTSKPTQPQLLLWAGCPLPAQAAQGPIPPGNDHFQEECLNCEPPFSLTISPQLVFLLAEFQQ